MSSIENMRGEFAGHLLKNGEGIFATKCASHSGMECGGKRSATPLFLELSPSASAIESGVALRLPPHSI